MNIFSISWAWSCLNSSRWFAMRRDTAREFTCSSPSWVSSGSLRRLVTWIYVCMDVLNLGRLGRNMGASHRSSKTVPVGSILTSNSTLSFTTSSAIRKSHKIEIYKRPEDKRQEKHTRCIHPLAWGKQRIDQSQTQPID